MNDEKTCFKAVDYKLSGLLHYIDVGDIGLPDIQRPFVWPNTKVRDLFDSMYRGSPVGYLLFWENGRGGGHKQIGVKGKQHAVPARLIVDGQQRLTSLYAVFRREKVIDDDYKEREIEIAFCPRDGTFKVTDAFIRKDPEWIANISDVWASGKTSYQLVKDFLKRLEENGPLTEQEETQISNHLDQLFDLQDYPFTALEIASSVDEEAVADVFVRINSQGVKLNQADFILTLMSVFWDEGRADLETFCREARLPVKTGSQPSPSNHLIEPEPDQLLRVSVALGFNRGRLKSVYNVLRGKDVETGQFNEQRRQEQFGRLQKAQAQVLDLKHWHNFVSCLIGAGFRSSELISSENALLYSYAFYLIGVTRFGLPVPELQQLVGRWFFAASLTGRYTASPESAVDEDLNRIKDARDARSFRRLLEQMIEAELTEDFWNISLPAALDSSSAQSPTWMCFVAAQVVLGAPVLFSSKPLLALFDPSVKPARGLERHHLFPKAWLQSQGTTETRITNQVANFALLECPDNMEISDAAPTEYVPEIRKRFLKKLPQWESMGELHALPDGWEHMDYLEFLRQRRQLMAGIIRRGFDKLS